MASLADRLGMDGQTKDIRLGDTFNRASKSSSYLTIRYDFKPQSIDTQKMGTVEVVENHEVTVTLPHREGSGQSQTVFMGNQKPIAKECLLIIDHNTGNIVLERISSHIALKKTREEGSSRIGSQRPPTPLSQGLKNTPPHKSPSNTSHGSTVGSSPFKSHPSSSHNMKVVSPPKMSPHLSSSPIPSMPPISGFMPTKDSMPMFGMVEPNIPDKPHDISVMSDSSSDSDSESNSNSSSSSDSDSDSEPEQPIPKKSNGNISALATNLNHDLMLSEDNSEDSDNFL